MSASSPVTPAFAASPGYWSGVLRRFRREKFAVGAAVVLVLILLAALFADYVAPADPSKAAMLRRLRPIGTPGYPLGADELGRDMLSRLIHGARLSLFMGVVPVFVAFLVGSTVGISAGFFGGRFNTIVMRTVDIFYAFPSVLLAIALSGALGAGIANSILSLTIVFIPPIARIAESVTTQVRGLDYIDAARASGAGSMRIIRSQVIGNVIGPVFVYATSLISVAMILASGLSFLGLGAKPPTPEWGLMLNTLRTAIYIQPAVAVLPGVAIFITSIAFNVLSDGLRAAMEVKN